MKIGYARVSASDQNENRQIDALSAYGIDLERIYTDKASGKDLNRPQYKTMLRTLRKGDILVIKSIDRLGRSYDDIKDEFKRITELGAHIHVIDMPILNTDQTITEGLTTKFIVDLVLSVLGFVAEQERQNIRQRQAEGIKSAKARKVKFGRPTIDTNKIKQAQALVSAGTTVKDACAKMGISRRVYYKYL